MSKLELVKTELKSGMKFHDSEISKSVREAFAKFCEERESIFRTAILENAVPKIKGEITAGKLRWRGIAICHLHPENESWITQKGKRISPVVKLGK